ncbi:MAG: NAD(P)H-dependent oxidoreductase subunit E [Chloroflexi bacterium]|nr:NAD(P)H-dependent oxidoreductase subunit E [Chloroflexota bacterium]
MDQIIAECKQRSGSTMLILNQLQAELGHISRPMQNYLAEKLNVPLKDIYGVVTFYSFFTMKPRGKHVVRVCMGTACHVRGATKILDRLIEKLEIRAGETTPDRQITLETVNCLGACALGPVIVTDSTYSGQMNVAKTDRLIKTLAQERK